MPNSLDISKRTKLVKFGFPEARSRDYGVILDGFDEHLVKLELHTGRRDQTPYINMRVGNPRQIDNGEADYLLRKMLAGYYPWPVDECLAHEFEGSNNVKVNGCKWCRERNNNLGSSGDVADATPELDREAVSPESSASVDTATPPVITPLESLVCVDCGWVSVEVTARGKVRSIKQRQHTLKMHRKAAHRVGVPS